MRLFYCILYIAGIGLASHLIGEALPRRWFDATTFPYAPAKWEDGGRIYRKIRIHKWKDIAPDMSKISPLMVKKKVRLTCTHADMVRLTQETCVAEAVHVALMLLSFNLYLIWPCFWGALAAIVYGLSHLPFIFIQRYNRPTLVLLAKRLKEREERKKNAHTSALG